MLRVRLIPVIVILLVLAAGLASAADRSGYDRLVRDMDAARLAGADVFAPKTWRKAAEAWEKARRDLDQGKDQRTLDEHVAEAAEYTANAVKAAEVGKLSLQEYVPPRDRALQAGAPKLVPELWAEAEEKFLEATRKVEEGDVKDGLKKAAEAAPRYDKAELEAFRVALLGAADKLIARAEADEAQKYAPSTLDKARSARSKANTILTSDRYNRDEVTALAARAEFEARHATAIAVAVRSLERNDQAWEKLMLGYEIHMNRVAAAFDLDRLPFDEGAPAATEALLAEIETLQAERADLAARLDGVSTSLQNSLTAMGIHAADDDPVALAHDVGRGIETMQQEQRSLTLKLQSGRADLAALAEQQAAAEAELAERREREAKFRTAKSLLSPSEGEVLYNAANDVVLRLHGLSFNPGSADILDEHMELLAKVQKVVEMYPEARIVIEGHTDTLGDPARNVTLSQNRSYAVMKYLREAMLLPAEKVRSVGYGADHPVASNRTDEGRAKNRRIDIVIMQ